MKKEKVDLVIDEVAGLIGKSELGIFRRVVFFGSAMAGMKPGSDVDLVVVTDRTIALSAVEIVELFEVRVLGELKLPKRNKIDFHVQVMTTTDWENPMADWQIEARNKGRVIYERSEEE